MSLFRKCLAIAMLILTVAVAGVDTHYRHERDKFCDVPPLSSYWDFLKI